LHNRKSKIFQNSTVEGMRNSQYGEKTRRILSARDQIRRLCLRQKRAQVAYKKREQSVENQREFRLFWFD